MGIKKHREAKGYTQHTLAEKLGVSPAAVAMWETGERIPRASTLAKMAELFGCSMDDLMRKEE